MFSALEGLADKQNPLNVQAEGRREGRKKGGDLQRVQICAKLFREGPRKTIALLQESSSPPALSFKANHVHLCSFPSGQTHSHSRLHLCFCQDRKLRPDRWTKWQEVKGLGCTIWWFDALSVTSPCKDVCNSIFRHKGRARSKPLELSTLAFLSPLQKACEGNEGVLVGGVALVNIGPCDGKEWGLKEVSRSQQAVIKESGSFFSTGKGEAHLIKMEMFSPPVKTRSWKKKSGAGGQRGEILDWRLDNTGSLLYERSSGAQFSTFQFYSVWTSDRKLEKETERRERRCQKGLQKHLTSQQIRNNINPSTYPKFYSRHWSTLEISFPSKHLKKEHKPQWRTNEFGLFSCVWVTVLLRFVSPSQHNMGCTDQTSSGYLLIQTTDPILCSLFS